MENNEKIRIKDFIEENYDDIHLKNVPDHNLDTKVIEDIISTSKNIENIEYINLEDKFNILQDVVNKEIDIVKDFGRYINQYTINRLKDIRYCSFEEFNYKINTIVDNALFFVKKLNRKNNGPF